MNVSVCIENPMINEDIKLFSQALSDDGEMIGEQLRVLSRLLKERNGVLELRMEVKAWIRKLVRSYRRGTSI